MNDSEKIYNILFEASKLYQPGQDGVKRYTVELLKELFLQTEKNPNIGIDLLLGKHIVPIEQYFRRNESGKVEKKETAIAHDMHLFKEGLIMNILSAYFSGPFILFKQKAFDFYHSRYYAVMLTMLTRLGKGKYPDLISEIEKYDLIHVALPQNVLFFESVQGNFITTVHDISHQKFPEYHTRDNINRSEKGIQLCLKKKSDFISVSQATASDVIAEYSIHENKIKIIHEGVDLNVFYPRNKQDDFRALDRQYQLSNKQYFLSIGTLEPRKNLIKTIRAFLLLEKETEEDIYLIVVGGKGWKNRKIKKQLNVRSDKVIFMGFVPDTHLRYFYLHALSLVYPSFYEGFGLPLLEAMACGTPVIYGNNSAMPEVVSQGGLGVDVEEMDAIKIVMHKMLNEKLRTKIQKKAFGRALELSWDKTAGNTLDYYDVVLRNQNSK